MGFNAIRLVGSALNQNLTIDAKEAGHLLLQAVATGNVGIGTDATFPPTTRLSVRSIDDQPSTTIVQALANNRTLGVGIGFNAIRLVGSAPNQNLTIDAKEAGHLLLQAAATGNVGIGTDAAFPPTSRLSVRSIDDQPSTMILQALANNRTLGVGIGFNAIRLVGSAPSQALSIDAKEAAHLLLQTTATGNVGIGTVMPQAKLHVAGNVGIGISTPTAYRLDVQGGDTRLKSSDRFPLYLDGGNPSLPFASVIVFRKSDATPAWQLGSGATTGVNHEFALVDAISGQTRLYVRSDGNVGIGTNGPQERLDVSGKVHVTSEIYVDGPLNQNQGRVAARRFYMLDGQRALVRSNGTKLADDSGCYYA
jgi:hypothetical protein